MESSLSGIQVGDFRMHEAGLGMEEVCFGVLGLCSI